MMSEKLQSLLTKLRNHLLELYGDRLDRTILFGSQARGEATEQSLEAAKVLQNTD